MSYKLGIICLLTVLVHVSSKRPFNLFFDELKCTHYGAPVKELFCHRHFQENKTIIDAKLVMPMEVNDFEFRGLVEIPRGEGETYKLLNLTLDGCKLLEDVESNDLFKVCLQMMREAGNIPQKCPIAANEIITLNKLILNPDILPNFSPEFAFLVNVDFLFNRKIGIKLYIKGRVEMKRKRKFFKT